MFRSFLNSAETYMCIPSVKRSAILVVALCLMAACSGPAEDKQRAMTPDVRYRTLPIVRPLRLVAMEQPLLVEFEAPKPSPNATPQLAVTVRVRESATRSSAEVRDQVTRLGLAAEVRLIRMDEGREVPVRLARFVPRPDAAATAVEVGPDGLVPGAEPYTVDISSLIDAGIIEAGEGVRTLAFAWAPDAQAGTYRLSLRLIDPPAELAHVHADLLLAYQFRYK